MKALNEFMLIMTMLRSQEQVEQFYQEDLRGITRYYNGEYGKPRMLRFINTKGEHRVGKFIWSWAHSEIIVQRVQGTTSKLIKPGKLVRPVITTLINRDPFEMVFDFLKPREYRMWYTRCI